MGYRPTRNIKWLQETILYLSGIGGSKSMEELVAMSSHIAKIKLAVANRSKGKLSNVPNNDVEEIVDDNT
jgi:hypothetical protein